jgi:hypothetical protein
MQEFNKSDLTVYWYLTCVLFSVCGWLCHVIIHVPDPKIFNYTVNVCNQEVYWMSVGGGQPKYETLCACSWWEKYITLNNVSAKNTLFLCTSVFPI